MSLTDIAIDFGTSTGKVGIFTNGVLKNVVRNVNITSLKGLLSEEKPRRVIACSVSHSKKEIVEVLKEYNFHYLTYQSKLPFEMEYKTPESLGTDRIAAVAGARDIFPKRNCLIIDAGTCITYELLTEKEKYLGGAISPGIDIKFKALNNFTVNLPLLKRNEEVDLIGNTTKNAIQSGVIMGTLAEIREIIRFYHNKFPNLQLVICGGDAKYIADRLNIDIYNEPNLVLLGLLNILNYNEK